MQKCWNPCTGEVFQQFLEMHLMKNYTWVSHFCIKINLCFNAISHDMFEVPCLVYSKVLPCVLRIEQGASLQWRWQTHSAENVVYAQCWYVKCSKADEVESDAAGPVRMVKENAFRGHSWAELPAILILYVGEVEQDTTNRWWQCKRGRKAGVTAALGASGVWRSMQAWETVTGRAGKLWPRPGEETVGSSTGDQRLCCCPQTAFSLFTWPTLCGLYQSVDRVPALCVNSSYKKCSLPLRLLLKFELTVGLPF